MSMEHWSSLTGLTATRIPKQFPVLGQNMSALSEHYFVNHLSFVNQFTLSHQAGFASTTS